MGSPAAANDRFARYAWLTLVANVLVVLWGAYVRATGSGAGCGGHWPLCNGVVVPREPALATLIEYTHRLSSGVALLLVLGLLVWAWRAYPRGSRIRGSSLAAAGFMVLEALLGAGLVLFELVAGNTSAVRAFAGALHLLNTFLLLAALTLTASWATWPYPGGRARPGKGRALAFGIGLLGVLFIGMTGAIAALGDTLFPSTSLLSGFMQDLDPQSNLLLRLRGLHPIVAIAVSFYLIGLIRFQQEASRTPGRLPALLIGIIALQLAAGAINVLLLAPVWLQLLHLALADSLWISFVLYTDRVLFGHIAGMSAAA